MGPKPYSNYKGPYITRSPARHTAGLAARLRGPTPCRRDQQPPGRTSCTEGRGSLCRPALPACMVSTCLHTHTTTRTYAYMHTHTRVYARVHARVHICAHTCTNTWSDSKSGTGAVGSAGSVHGRRVPRQGAVQRSLWHLVLAHHCPQSWSC